MLGIELDGRSRAVFTVQREQGSNAIIAHNCTRGRPDALGIEIVGRSLPPSEHIGARLA